jgi:hypothetical protein
MPATYSRRSNPPPMPSSAAMLVSLSHALDTPQGPLGRQARRLAAHIARHPSDRALQRRAGDLLALLLAETDAGLAIDDDDGLLDSGFDS